MKVPVVLPVVHVEVGTDGHLVVDLDGQPYDADRTLERGDLRTALDEITSAHGTAVRVEVREADGTTYADIATPPESAQPPDSQPPADVPSPGINGAGFEPGEEVAVAYVLARQTPDAAGVAALHLPPAVLASRRDGLVLLGMTSRVVASIG